MEMKIPNVERSISKQLKTKDTCFKLIIDKT